MIGTFLRWMTAAIVVSLGLAGGAAALNFDGYGIVRFGVFGAGTSYNINDVGNNLGSASLDGAAVGFAAGYDMIFARRLLLGVEADLTVGDNGKRFNGIVTRADYLATLRGRLGVFLTPDFLVYGTGGVAWNGLSVKDTITSLTTPIDTSHTAPGWVAGGGLEYDMRDYFGTIVFAEYLVGGFNSWKNVPGFGVDLESDVQTFRVGVKFKVGHDYHEDLRRADSLK